MGSPPTPVTPDAAIAGGFYEVTTTSLIDWPQPARLIEMLEHRRHVIHVLIDSS